MAPALTEQQLADLAVARELAAADVPIFIAPPDPSTDTGFRLPNAWQQTEPDPAVADRWQPGMALCAVMGRGLDLLDVDPRNGGGLAALDGEVPTSYASALTPSGGLHAFVASLGVRSINGFAPGLDLKSGEPTGEGRGCAFLAPTVKASKVDGRPAPYRWAQPPAAGWRERAASDTSGAALAARVRALRADAGVRSVGGPDWWRGFITSREPQSQAAAERAIAEKLGEVTAWDVKGGAGFRQALMRAAMTLGGYVGGGYLDETDAWQRLEGAVREVWGAPDKDDRRWIGQGLGDGAAQPFHVYTPADEQAFGDAAQAVAATRTANAWSPYRALGPEPFDPVFCSYDQEFAEAVAARTAPVLRYAADAGSWLVRGPEVWRERDDLSGWAVAMVARLMPPGLTPVPKDATQRTEQHWQAVRRQRLMASAGAGAIERKLRAILRGGEHPGALELSDLDTDPEILWAGGMPWDLRASVDGPALAGIDPATPHLRSAACAPELRATPAWDAFTSAVWPDPALRAWALRVLGITLAGYPDAALPVLYGAERTGKTSLVALLVKVLGGYAHAADPRLLAGADNAHASVVYALKGRRLSFIDEGPRRGYLAAERLKQLTGGGQLTGNAMRSNPVTFAPTHTLVMTTNDEPPITDPALRARMRIIPCEAEQEPVRLARQAITAAVWEVEAPGVLAALMRECAAWLADPTSALPSAAPLDVQASVGEMAAGQDPVREWVDNATVPAHPGTPGRELYTAFVRWHADSPLHRRTSPPSETAFGRSLSGQGYPAHKVGGAWYRPLSVLGGPAGIAPWEPLPSPHMTPGSGGFLAGSGGFVAGSPSQPARVDSPTSAPVFAPTVAGLAGFSRPIDNRETTLLHIGDTAQNTQGNGGSAPNPPEAPANPGGDLGLAGLAGNPPQPARPPAASSQPSAPSTAPSDAAPAPASPRSVSKAGAARRADEAKISKAEARRQLAEEKRQAAIAEAAGPTVGLPAVVGRDGTCLPVTLDQAAALIGAALERSGALTVDVETSGYPVGHADYALRSVQLGDAEAAVVLHPAEHAALIRDQLAAAPALHAFSATADLVPLAHAGLLDVESAWARMHDTVIPAKLADPKSAPATADGLKALAAGVLREHATAPRADEAREALFKAGRWLKQTEVDTPVERSGWAQVETGSTTMLRYAASDVLDTAALARTLPLPARDVYDRERLAQRMTARVAHHGVRIDAGQVAALTGPAEAARAEAGERVRAFGVENPGSDKQIGEAALRLGADLPRSPKTGAPSVAAGVLEPLRGAEGPLGAFVSAVLDWRHHDTVLGTFLGPYRTLCERGDGRARPTVYTVGTNTGRMSCVRPNLQQLPREGGVRACITADPGQLMIGADFSGVELRVAAAISGDSTLQQLIRDGIDVHGEVAKLVWGPGATKANRYTAKRGVFGWLYGGGVKNLARQLGVSVEVMQQVIDALGRIAPGLPAWSEWIKQQVRAGHTQFPSYSGRVIHLPADRPHAAPNYVIQGSARELLVDALVRWSGTRWGSAVLLPVHDELDVFVPEAEAHDATAELIRCMETELHGVRIVADPSTPAFAWQDST